MATPVALFLLLAVLLYVPPVQQVVKDKVASLLSDNMGMDVRIGRVRLAFPLDLSVNNMLAVAGGDTLIAAGSLRLNVKVIPLLKKKIDVSGFELWRAQIDTKSYVSDTRIKGRVGLLKVVRPALLDLVGRTVNVSGVKLADGDIRVLLSDTAKKDTAKKEPVRWKISVKRAAIDRTRFFVRMPGDSMRIGGRLQQVRLSGGDFNLEQADYRVDRLSVRRSAVNYDIPQAGYAKGFDTNHIAVTDLNLQADTVRYYRSRLTAGVPLLAFNEKSGFRLNRLQGRVDLDSAGVKIPVLHIKTPGTEIDAVAHVEWAAFKSGRNGKMDVRLRGHVARKDILLFAGDAAGKIQPFYPDVPLRVDAAVGGNARVLRVHRLYAALPGYVSLSAGGTLFRPFDNSRKGDIHYQVQTYNTRYFTRRLPASFSSSVNLPARMQLGGTLTLGGADRYATGSTLRMGRGSLRIDGRYNVRSQDYDARIVARRFPLNTLLRGQSLSPLTAALTARGHGFDFLGQGTRLAARGNLQSFSYDKYPLSNTAFNARLVNGKAMARLVMNNDMMKGNLNVDADIRRRNVQAAIRGAVEDFALSYVSGPKDSTRLMADIDVTAYFEQGGKRFGAEGKMANINVMGPSMGYPANDIFFRFGTAPDTTHARISSGDFVARIHSDRSLPKIADRAALFAQTLTRQLKNARIDQNELSSFLPDMTFHIEAGRDNPFSHLLHFHGYDMDSLYADISTLHGTRLDGNLAVVRFNTGQLLLERTTARIYQDSAGLKLDGMVKNTDRKNPNRFTAHLYGAVLPDGGTVEAKFVDEKNVVGLDFGLRARMAENGDVTFSLFPEKSVIAYRTFTVNKDNFLTIGKDNYISANVDLLADDRTGVKITTPQGDSARDVTVSLNHINLNELSAVVPYFPEVGGLLSGDVHARWDEGGKLSLAGALDMKDFSYQGTPLGNLETDVAYLPKDKDNSYISANIFSQGREVMNLFGDYSTAGGGHVAAQVNLLKFPAPLLDGFLGNDGTVALAGYLDGALDIEGPTSKLQIDGKLTPDSLHVLSPLYGVDLRVENKPVDIVGSTIRLDSLALYSKTDNPLRVSGGVDFSNTDAVTLDLRFKAKNFPVINSPRTKESLLFGKVYSDIDATLKGTTSFMILRGDLGILDRTNMTYIMKDSPLTVEDQLSGLVEFVDFSDTTKTEKTETAPPGGMFMTLKVKVNDGAKLHCELSTDGSSYFDCSGGGSLTMRYFPSGEIMLNGRYTMDKGEMKYELPFIPLKTFQLKEGSYISFRGDPYNPALHITATEATRASVNDEGSSTRMVAFNVGVAISQTLNNMGLQFLIDAPEDMNVQNELASMSAEERSKVAVSLLTTGMYLTNTNRSSFKANNALNAFLQNEIQSVAGNALKTIDLTVGVEGSTSASGNAQTDYSFQFAKHFWNDRVTFKIGGKVTAGSENTNENQSFIDNVSLEYRLGQGYSRNLRLFYDHDNVDPLEGVYSSAGAGLVLRKKTNTFGELFIFRPKRKKVKTEAAAGGTETGTGDAAPANNGAEAADKKKKP